MKRCLFVTSAVESVDNDILRRLDRLRFDIRPEYPAMLAPGAERP